MGSKLLSLNLGKDPIILVDDVNSRVSYLMGAAESVSGENVNFMTHFGKGLVYVCITSEKAKELNLPLIEEGNLHNRKDFTVSVDHKSNSTGISAFERSDTIKAFTQWDVKPEDFKRPGHIFPLIRKENKVLERIGIAEAAVFLLELKSKYPVAYVCEILNDEGEVANKNEVEQLSNSFGLSILNFSEIVKYQYENTQWISIVDSQYLDESKNIIVYRVHNDLSKQEFKVFARQADKIKNIIFYQECQLGDLLGSNQCGCKNHLKDYYKLLMNKDVDAIVFENNHSASFKDFMMKDFISKQITEMIHEKISIHKMKMEVGSC